MGATLVSTGDRIANDNNKKVGVIGAYNLPIVEWTRLIDTDTPKPGYTLQWKAGAGGEDSVQDLDIKGEDGIAFAEFDPGLVANCDTAYAATDEIPIIPFMMNPGAICRNVHCANPASDINAGASMTISGTAGLLILVVEMAMETGSATGGYQFQVNTLGTNAAAGTYNLSRVYATAMYFLTDPSAAYQDVHSIVWCR
jgi:hypothetical protein